MKTLLLISFSFSLLAQMKPAEPKLTIPKAAVEPAKPPADPTAAQAREVRELQLAVAMAIINKTESEKASQKAIEDAQLALGTKVMALKKAAACEACTLGDDLKWKLPPAPNLPQSKH